MTGYPRFAATSLRDAAASLREAGRRVGFDLHALPYNRYDSDDCTWWLCPGAENPAYSLGKLVVERSTEIEDGRVIVGLHIEKGIGPAAEQGFESARDRRLVMEQDWIWHGFMRALKTGSADQDFAAATAAAGEWPLSVAVVAAIQLPHAVGDVGRPISPKVERAWYRAAGTTLRLEGRASDRLLAAFGTSETPESLARKIEAMPDRDWAWVEFLIGIPFELGAGEGVAPAEIWRRACEPWRRWLR